MGFKFRTFQKWVNYIKPKLQIFGAIAIGCGGHSFESEYVFERVFLWSTVTCFIISFLYFLLHFLSDGVSRSSANKGVVTKSEIMFIKTILIILKLQDILYHVLAGILLIIGGALMVASVKKYDRDHCNVLPWGPPCQLRKSEKLAGAVMNYCSY